MFMGARKKSGLSPSIDHKLGQSMQQKLNSPIVEHFNNNNMLLDKSEVKRGLLEGYPPRIIR